MNALVAPAPQSTENTLSSARQRIGRDVQRILELTYTEFLPGDPTGHRSRVEKLRTLSLREFLEVYHTYLLKWCHSPIISDGDISYIRSFQVLIDEYAREGKIIAGKSQRKPREGRNDYKQERGRVESSYGYHICTEYEIISPSNPKL